MKWEDGERGYKALWTKARVTNAAKVKSSVERIIAGRTRYESMWPKAGVPWWFIGILHSLESNCDFRTHLHNGDPLATRTTHVPAGRPATGEPPFTWEESAVDALAMKGLTTEHDWSPPKALWNFERYNGFGYVAHGVNSPYVWSGTDLYTRGKYVADGVWDASAVSAQIGAAAIMIELGLRDEKGTAMSLSAFESLMKSASPSGASLLASPLAAIALRELAAIVGVSPDGDKVEESVASTLAGQTVSGLIEVLGKWEEVVKPLAAALATPAAAPAATPTPAPATPTPAPAAAPAPAAPAPAPAMSVLDSIFPALTGYKTALGVVLYVLVHVAAIFNFAPTMLTPDVLSAFDAIAGGIVGVGLLAKIDRIIQFFVPVVKK